MIIFHFDGAQLVRKSFSELCVPNNNDLVLGLFSASTGPVTVADQAAEESMVSVILENFPSHAMLVFRSILVSLLGPQKNVVKSCSRLI